MKRKNSGYYYTLTFAVKFESNYWNEWKYILILFYFVYIMIFIFLPIDDFDCVYFAHCYPYTYT